LFFGLIFAINKLNLKKNFNDMKNIFISTTLFFYCISSVFAQDNHLKLLVNIDHRSGDLLTINTSRKNPKNIKINSDGFFNDTLSVKPGIYQMFDGAKFVEMFLKNGYDLTVTYDTEQIDKTLVFSGTGEEENKYIINSRLREKDLDFDKLLKMKLIEFKAALEKKKEDDIKRLEDSKLDSVFINCQKSNIEKNISEILKYYYKVNDLEKPIEVENPQFEYEDNNGKFINLKSFKGKFVYIQIWSIKSSLAKAEAPYLREIIRKYSNQGFAFVNISLDPETEYDNWKAYIDENELTGTQLIADLGWKSMFLVDFQVTSIPRYILLDADGKILQPNAPRPSNPRLREGFEQLINEGVKEND
jgi:thiol-disulfide isomerase/thioredoxin